MPHQTLQILIGGRRSIRNCIGVWLATGALNLLCVCVLWIEVRYGLADRAQAAVFTMFIAAAQLLFAFGVFLATVLAAEESSRVSRELKEQRDELEQLLRETRRVASFDELTGLRNRRSMTELIAMQAEQHCRKGNVLCLGLIDIDFFKGINDRYGHAGGDEVLRRFASQAASSIRPGDVIARWGGEEFLLLLPDTSTGEAELVIQKLRHEMAAVVIQPRSQPLQITFSAGVSRLTAEKSPADAIARADIAMFRAKQSGRNCTCVHDPAQDTAHARVARRDPVDQQDERSWYPEGNYRTDGWPELRPVPVHDLPSALEAS